MATYCIGNFINDPSPNDRLMFIYNCSGKLTVSIDPYASTFFQKSRYVYVVTDGKMNYDNVLDFTTESEAEQAVARLNDVKKIFIDRTNNTLSGCVNLVSKCEFYNHTGDTNLHTVQHIHDALYLANNPSSANTFATLEDIIESSGDTKQVKVSIVDDHAGFLIEKLSGSTYVNFEILNPSLNEILKINIEGLTPLVTFYQHTGNTNLHLSLIQKDALDNSNNPSASNPFATFNDITVAASGLTIPVADARYVKQTGDTMTGSLVIDANLTVTGLTKTNNLELESGITVNTISNDTGLTNSSSTSLVTENAVKQYVDSRGWFSVEATRYGIIYAPVDLLRGGVTTSDSPFIAPYKCRVTEISISTQNYATWTGFTEVFNPNNLVTPVWSYPIYVNNEITKTIEFDNSFTIQKGYIIRMRIGQLINSIKYPTMTIFLGKK
ncbi:MAG: hypothetical protein HPY57_13960 [Ignavibacteria bacterium]|nr:hypothetical protein [Ignavibacteria bacterium]